MGSLFQVGYITLLFFGFPAGIISLLLSALGIWRKWPWLLVVAGLFTITEMIYFSLGSGLPFYLMALLQFYGAYVLRKGNARLAWILLIPLLLITALFAQATIVNMMNASRY
jgi:hypothetical protein